MQLLHQVDLGVQSARRIHDEQLDAAGAGRAHRVKHHGPGIRTRVLGHDRHADAVAPHLELIDRRRAERVPGSQHDAVALLFPVVSQLGDAGGLADAVDADDQQHGELSIGGEHRSRVSRRDFAQAQHQLLAQHAIQIFGVGSVPELDLVAQDFQQLIGGVHADISLQQQLLELLPQVLVDRPRLLEDARQAGKDALA